jgi:DNA ligase-associated metallophosphoesterase
MPNSSDYFHRCCGEELQLLPERALYWRAQRCLLLSDLHLAKAGHFRRYGIAVSGEVMRRDLAILDGLLQRLEPERILFLGDLFHSSYNSEFDWFARQMATWRQAAGARGYTLSFELVPGNHVILPASVYEEMNIRLHSRAIHIGPFVLTHQPAASLPPERYLISGHVHPGIRLTGRGRQSLRLPCFHFGSRQALLPAFGGFTGLQIIQPQAEDSVYAVAEGRVVPIPA